MFGAQTGTLAGLARDLGFQAALDKYTQTKSVWVALDR